MESFVHSDEIQYYGLSVFPLGLLLEGWEFHFHLPRTSGYSVVRIRVKRKTVSSSRGP